MVPPQKCFAKATSLKLPTGFTLPELLIAAFLTMTVVMLGGWAMANIISYSKTSSSKSDRRIELNRALDFIASEVREASAINIDPQSTEFSPAATEIDPASVQNVLVLNLQELPRPVIYYLAAPASTNKTWRGPKVVYRWGPTFSTSGQYGSDKTTPTTWTHQPLIDALESTTSVANCDTGWTTAPAVSPSGFYACISPTHRIAKLFQKGKISKVLGGSEPYLLQTQALTRSSTSVFAIKPATSGGGSQIVLTNPSNVSIQMLGSDLRCGEGGTPMKTIAQVNVTVPGGVPSAQAKTVDPVTLAPDFIYNSQPIGTTFDFTGKVLPQSGFPEENPHNICSAESISGSNGFNSLTSSNQVKILKDGDTVPSVSAFGNGESVKRYLQDYIDSTGRVVRLPNPQFQSIILFELGITDTTNAAYDLQDLVLLATVNPT
jgi:hypothetical protein